MDKKGAALVERVRMQLKLPAHLRTEHWYNDWQHAIFIIKFNHLIDAIRRRSELTSRLMDTLTVYLNVHFLCEEEGMAWSVEHGCLTLEKMAQHQALHMTFVAYWHQTIQRPYRQGSLTGDALAAKVQDYYDRVMAHIDDDDQSTYGAKTTRGIDNRLGEVAHLAQSGLPLSPNMPGAFDVVGACSADAHGLLRRAELPSRSVEPLAALRLAAEGVGATDSLRARFLRGRRGQPAA